MIKTLFILMTIQSSYGFFYDPLDWRGRRIEPAYITHQGSHRSVASVSQSLKQAATLHKKVQLNFNHQVSQARHGKHLISVLSPEQARELFQRFASIPYMQFKNLEDGCYNRAQEFGLIAKANGITMGKVFVEHQGVDEMYENWAGAGAPNFDDSADTLLFPESFSIKPRPVSDHFAGWSYHVAPYLLVKDEQGIRPYIFDMGVISFPKDVESWKKHLHYEPHKLKTTFTPAHYLNEDGSSTSKRSSIGEDLEREREIERIGAKAYYSRYY